MTPILISRFLLNLRQLGEPENETQTSFKSRLSIPGFRVPTSASIVDSMGADLDHGPIEHVDDEAEDADVHFGNEARTSIDQFTENLPGAPFTEEICKVPEVML